MSKDYHAFKQQSKFHYSQARIRGVFCGKRSGKTECGAVEANRFSRYKIGYKEDLDAYAGMIAAPTRDMLRTLSMQKFMNYASPQLVHPDNFNKTHQEAICKNGAVVYGMSADRPQRLEGKKLYWAWLDEVFQMSEQFFLEVLARVGDQKGIIWCTGSLGVQYVVPKYHWVYKYFKEPTSRLEGVDVFEWDTRDNPYFPKDELERLKRTLDQRTFRQMFELSWEGASQYAIYDELDDTNQLIHEYNPKLETCISIDWGWTNDMACGFFQYDPKENKVFLFDEIVGSKIKLDDLWKQISSKGYSVNRWYCDAAGKQTREQSGVSNIDYFKREFGISFGYRQTAITYGIPIVRSFIRNGLGQAKFYIHPRCRKSWDQMKNYRYAEKNGIMQEVPVKENDHCPDMIRYYFLNRHDKRQGQEHFGNLNRWGNTWLT